MKNKIVIIFLLTSIVFLSGCVSETPLSGLNDSETAKVLCIQDCNKALQEGIDLNNGPCLSQEIIDDWVCDVAHSPREGIDNLPENQCESFRKKVAHHFVEVDTNCNFLRGY